MSKVSLKCVKGRSRGTRSGYFSTTETGFTMIELIVVIAVVAIILSVVFFDSRGANNNLTLTNDAHLIAGAIREAQVSGQSVREVQNDDPSITFEQRFESGYGIHFGTSAGNNTAIVYFVDLDGSGSYAGAGNTSLCTNVECVQSISLKQGNTIHTLCGVRSDGSEECPVVSGTVDMVFKRPSTDTLMNFSFPNDGFVEAKVVIRSFSGDTKEIVVGETGYISVQ
ncbi:MAG: prepilin-type N-terminal cleavage/methylation domain-containing protein [Candidatus Paceibacterota bacterium]